MPKVRFFKVGFENNFPEFKSRVLLHYSQLLDHQGHELKGKTKSVDFIIEDHCDTNIRKAPRSFVKFKVTTSRSNLISLCICYLMPCFTVDNSIQYIFDECIFRFRSYSN